MASSFRQISGPALERPRRSGQTLDGFRKRTSPADPSLDNPGLEDEVDYGLPLARFESMSPKASETGPRLRVGQLKSPLAGPFDLDLAAGECAVVAGPSGSGKSLFLRMIADLDPSDGEVALDGVSRESMSGPQWRRCAPYVAADSGWWLERVSDHFAPGKRAAGQALAERLGLTDGQFDGPVLRLSTGERQRLALIRALVLNSPVLLLDEPTSALDPAAAAAVEGLLKERLAAGLALVLVSHDEAQAGRLGAAARFEMAERKLRRAL